MSLLTIIQFGVKIVFLALLIIFLLFFTLSFPLGAYVAFTLFGSESPQTLQTLPFFIFGLAATIKVRVDALTLLFYLIALYLFFVYVAAKEPLGNLLQTLRSVYEKGITFVQTNTLATVCTVFAPLLFVNVMLEYLQGIFGVSTGSLPRGEPLIDFVLLTYAPLSEEFGFRLTLIGFVASLPSLYYGNFKSVLYSLWRPSTYFSFSSRNLRAKFVLYSLIVFSAFMFGSAHVIYGGGWEFGKIMPAFVAGLCLGWLYVRWGFHAAVLLHLLFNYFAGSFDYFAELIASSFIVDLVSFIVYLLGVVVLMWLALKVLSTRLIGDKEGLNW
ncbi:MAG: type II CAAX prenyl endopeptidase Rce1 family protein [Nitrososphaerales archaeon]